MEKVKKQINTTKTVVISGCTSGLGKEMSISFANRGWQVAGLGKTKSKVEKMAETMGESHQILQCDVSCDDSVKTASSLIIKRFGAPNILINNAAVMNTPKPNAYLKRVNHCIQYFLGGVSKKQMFDNFRKPSFMTFIPLFVDNEEVLVAVILPDSRGRWVSC